MLALNNTWLPSNNTVVTLRYGMTKFIDDDTLSVDYDPSSSVSPAFSNAMQTTRSSRSVTVTDYYAFGAHRPDAAQLVFVERERHRVEAGRQPHLQVRARDYRNIGIETQSYRRRRRQLQFRSPLHFGEPDVDGVNSATPSRQRAGQPAARLSVGRPGQPEPRTVSEPVQRVHELLRRCTSRTTAASARSSP